MKNNIAQKSYLFLRELTFFQVNIQQIFPQLVQNPLNNFYVAISLIFGVNKNVIQVYNNKDIKLLQ